MSSVPIDLIIQFGFYLIVAGTVAGFLAGLFGIGGGTVLVPVFFQVFGAVGIDDSVRMQLAIGTSLAIVVMSSQRSLKAHRKYGVVDDALLKKWIFAVPLGALGAIFALTFISSGALRLIFAIVCSLIAVKLLIGRDDWRLGTDLPQNPTLAVVGASIGFLSTLMGIGGGVLNNTFMTAYGRPIHQAVGTSAGVGMLIALPGTLGYIWAGWHKAGLPPFSTGYVNWFAIILIIPLTIFVTPYGVKVAHALPKRKLELLLGGYLLFVAIRFGWSLV